MTKIVQEKNQVIIHTINENSNETFQTSSDYAIITVPYLEF